MAKRRSEEPVVVSGLAFIKGLNTEICGTVDASDYSKDELNCVIRNNGTRTRRLGIDYEEYYSFLADTVIDIHNDYAFSGTEWTDISNSLNKNYIVVQAGGTLYFFENNGQPYSKSQSSRVVDLSTYAFNPSSDEYKKTPLRYTQAYGTLFCCSKAVKPFRISQIDPEVLPDYNNRPATVTLSTYTANGRYGRSAFPVLRLKRDGEVVFCKAYNSTTGVLSDYPAEDGDTSATKYWSRSSVYKNWFAQRGGDFDYRPWLAPSALYWARILREAGLEEITNAVGNTPYNKEIGLNQYEEWEGREGKTKQAKESITISERLGSAYSGASWELSMMWVEPNKGGEYWKKDTRKGTSSGFVDYESKYGMELVIRDFKGVEDGMSFGEAISTMPTELSDEHKYNLRNQGWTNETIQDFYDNSGRTPKVYPANNMQWFIAKDETTKKFSPTLLLEKYFGNTPAPRGHFKLEYFNQDREQASGLEVASSEPRCPYVSDIASYAGRIFYLSGDTVLYSQVVAEDISKASLCCQEADPTAEELSDLLPTDGGMLQIPEIGEGVKLVHLGGSLAVVGTRGTYVISGGSENIFTATAYTSSAVQNFSTVSPLSFVQTDVGVFFWGQTGVVVMAVGGGESLINKTITDNSIQTFYDKIPEWARENCRGAYNAAQRKIVWVYPGDEKQPRNLNKALVFNLSTETWTPLEFASLESGSPFVTGIIGLQNAYKLRHRHPLMELSLDGEVEEEVSTDSENVDIEEPLDTEVSSFENILYICFDEMNSKITFGVLNNNNFKDWASGDISGSGVDFSSYCVSHPLLFQTPYFNKTMPYLLATFKRTEQGFSKTGEGIFPSSCQGAVLWDWNTNGDAGKWDAQQELYRYTKGTLLSSQYVSSKTRVHGSGRAFQIKLSSNANKNFIVENVGFQLIADGRI